MLEGDANAFHLAGPSVCLTTPSSPHMTWQRWMLSGQPWHTCLSEKKQKHFEPPLLWEVDLIAFYTQNSWRSSFGDDIIYMNQVLVLISSSLSWMKSTTTKLWKVEAKSSATPPSGEVAWWKRQGGRYLPHWCSTFHGVYGGQLSTLQK